jgi:Uma2 family endonuclease
VQSAIEIGQYWEPQPDVCLLRRRKDFYAGAHPGADDVLLVIQVAEASPRNDRERKTAYARAGIVELWLVDLEHDVIEVYREPRPQEYRQVRKLPRSEAIVPPS